MEEFVRMEYVTAQQTGKEITVKRQNVQRIAKMEQHVLTTSACVLAAGQANFATELLVFHTARMAELAYNQMFVSAHPGIKAQRAKNHCAALIVVLGEFVATTTRRGK